MMEGIDFFIHCQKDDDYASKIMSIHGTVNEVQGHSTFQMVRGEHITWMTITTGDMIPLTLQKSGGQRGDQNNNFLFP